MKAFLLMFVLGAAIASEPQAQQAAPSAPGRAHAAPADPAPAMPETAGHWLSWFIAGGALTGVGMIARKRRT